jgi:hypothetical protein
LLLLRHQPFKPFTAVNILLLTTDAIYLGQVFTVPVGVFWSVVGFVALSGLGVWAKVGSHDGKIAHNGARIEKLEAKHDLIMEKLDKVNDNVVGLRIDMQNKQNRV